MAPPRKPIQDKLNDIDAKIAKHNDQISVLKIKKQELIEADKKAKVEKLVEVMEKNNLTVDELLKKAND